MIDAKLDGGGFGRNREDHAPPRVVCVFVEVRRPPAGGRLVVSPETVSGVRVSLRDGGSWLAVRCD